MPTIKKQIPKKKTVKKKTTTILTKPKTRKKKKSGGSVLDRIENLEEQGDELIKINLYGKSGTGKTTLYGTFPKPILAIQCSGGLANPGELKSINTEENRGGAVQKVTLENPEEIRQLAEMQKTENRFATIALDHVTGFQDLVLCELLDLKEAPVQLSWGLATQNQWGQVAIKVKEYLRMILDLDCNIVIVGQERTFNDNNDGSDVIKPFVASALSPSTVGWLNPTVDYICQTFIRKKRIRNVTELRGKEVVSYQETDEVEYCLRTYPDDTYASKFRVPKGTKLPHEIVDPSYEKILSLIQGN